MAMTRKTTRDVGTSLVPVSNDPGSGFTHTHIGMSLCNKHSGSIAVDLLIRESGPTDTYVLKSFMIPSGETLFPFGQLGKTVTINGDVIYVKSSVAASLDVVAPYYKEAA